MENSEQNIQNEPAYSMNTLEFLRVAHEYCLFIENSPEKNGEEIMQFYQKICSLLYLKALLLPDIVPEYPEAAEHFVTEEERETIFNQLRQKFGTADEFWYNDPDNRDVNDLIKGSLAESLTDIYQDLKDFVLLYRKNSRAAKEAAVSGIKYLFYTRWSYSILHSITHVHQILNPITNNPDEGF